MLFLLKLFNNKASNWELEQAVELFFSNPTAPPPSTSQPTPQHFSEPFEEVRRPIDQHVSRLYADDSPRKFNQFQLLTIN
jgi:hypothetical protein